MRSECRARARVRVVCRVKGNRYPIPPPLPFSHLVLYFHLSAQIRFFAIIVSIVCYFRKFIAYNT